MAESPTQSLEALLEDLKSEEAPKKANAMKNINIIGTALGFDRCRNELIPYLNEFLDDEEEVLLAMAEIIPQLFDSVGGKAYAYLLLEVLEKLSSIEDYSVSLATVNSFKNLLSKLECNKLEIWLLDLANRMNASEWINSKLALTSILPVISKEFTQEGQGAVLDIFRSLLTGSNPQVRKLAAENFKHFIGKVHSRYENSLQELLGMIGVDQEDSVRVIAVEDLLASFSLMGVKNNSILMPVLRMLMDDKSWRVRYLVAEKLPEFAAIMSPEQRSGVLVSGMTKFLQDNEPEVRTGACRRLVDFCKLISPEDILAHIIPTLSPLISDFDYIKATFANNLSQLMLLVGRSSSNQHLLPLALEILRDNSPEIKICIFSDLEGMCGVVGSESLAQIIMPAIEELIEDKQWRIKLKILQCFPLLGKQLGLAFFEQNFLPIVKKMVFDSTYAVRQGLTQVIKDLIPVFGQKWVETKIVQDVCDNANNENCHKRLAVILFLKNIANTLSSDFINTNCLTTVNELATDNVPNIRLNAIKVIKEFIPFVKDLQSKDALKVSLRMLNKDEDTDVRFCAEQVLRSFS
jgi:serine/threonine-protein phosphatase 2A regulatory subunit A